MIDLKEISRAAEAIIQGPAHQLALAELYQDFNRIAGPKQVLELLDELDTAKRDLIEAEEVFRSARAGTNELIRFMRKDHDRLLEVLKAARLHDQSQTVSFDLTRGPGGQKVYEIDEVFVKALEQALAGCSNIKIEDER